MSSLPASVFSFLEREVLAGVPLAIRGERKFRSDQSEIEKTIEENARATTEISAASITALKEQEQSRRKALEEKARSSLTVVSICSTLVFTGLTFLTGQGLVAGARVRLALLLLFFFAVLYFVGGAISALRALQITRTWILNVNDERQTSGARELVYLDLNTMETNIKANWTDVSFACLRNAVVSLLVFAGIAVLLIIHPAKRTATLTPPTATTSVLLQTFPIPSANHQCEGSSPRIHECDCPESRKGTLS